MVYNIFSYRRPSETEATDRSTLASSRKNSGVSENSRLAGIPEALSFDRIISGGTCPPVTTRDFLQFMKNHERTAENLQFFLWYIDYAERFRKLSPSEKALSPPWDTPMNASPESVPSPSPRGVVRPSKNVSNFFANAFSGNRTVGGIKAPSDVYLAAGKRGNPFETPPRTPATSQLEGIGYSDHGITPFKSPNEVTLKNLDHKEVAAAAFGAVDVKWQPFTIQPFRDEITRVIAIYIAEGSPRELNVSFRDRTNVLHALANTTHPSALKPFVQAVEDSLRHQSHPNFIRWSIKNGNPPRVLFARCLGVLNILAGSVAAVLLTLSDLPRSYRAFAAIGWAVGIATFIAGWKGMCIVLHGLHHRHVRPWELWSEEEGGQEIGAETYQPKESFDTLGSNSSYEDEPWISRYDKRFFLRKIFDKEVWVEEPALRQIQDTIAIQSILVGIMLSAMLTAFFVALPVGGYL